ncbi:hypothetical protein [Brevibacillus porteri]|uniref:hypothetical protein n=1 Tax=Brevibacillus porteri TaxID=2126350 RepID=UPI00364268F5
MLHFKWYHSPIIAWAVVVEFLNDFARLDFQMDWRDFKKFAVCLAIVLAEIGAIGVILWWMFS